MTHFFILFGMRKKMTFVPVFYFSSIFWYSKIYTWILIKCSCSGCPKKLYQVLKLYFEVAKLLMSEILAFPASLELYNSSDILLVCFHGLINNLYR